MLTQLAMSMETERKQTPKQLVKGETLLQLDNDLTGTYYDHIKVDGRYTIRVIVTDPGATTWPLNAMYGRPEGDWERV